MLDKFADKHLKLIVAFSILLVMAMVAIASFFIFAVAAGVSQDISYYAEGTWQRALMSITAILAYLSAIAVTGAGIGYLGLLIHAAFKDKVFSK